MANDTTITVIGNTTAPAELRFTPSGHAVANWTIASTPRTFDRQSNEWKDGETLFLRCSAWREMAENVAESLGDKGMRIIVQGNLKQRSYEKDGEKRTTYELDVQEVGPALRYATAKVTKPQRGGGNNNSGFGNSQPAQQSQQWGGNAPQQDAWGTPQQGQQGAWDTPGESPF